MPVDPADENDASRVASPGGQALRLDPQVGAAGGRIELRRERVDQDREQRREVAVRPVRARDLRNGEFVAQIYFSPRTRAWNATFRVDSARRSSKPPRRGTCRGKRSWTTWRCESVRAWTMSAEVADRFVTETLGSCCAGTPRTGSRPRGVRHEHGDPGRARAGVENRDVARRRRRVLPGRLDEEPGVPESPTSVKTPTSSSRA